MAIDDYGEPDPEHHGQSERDAGQLQVSLDVSCQLRQERGPAYAVGYQALSDQEGRSDVDDSRLRIERRQVHLPHTLIADPVGQFGDLLADLVRHVLVQHEHGEITGKVAKVVVEYA